jgi:formylglycine-generating enzyme required for sulfatase activity
MPDVSDVFISYASADRPRVIPLVDALRQKGWSVWWDRTIPPGKTWDQVIEAALDGARCVIVLWSKDAVLSDWVRTEAEEGKRRGILVPARIDDVTIPLAFRRIQAADLVGWRGALPNAGFDELAEAVSGVLGEDVVKPVAKAAAATAAPGAPATVRAEPKPQPRPATVDPSGPPPLARSMPGIFKNRFVLFGLAAVVLTGILIYVQGRRAPTPEPAPSISRATEASATEDKASSNSRVNPKDGLNYVLIPAGKFKMGCSPGDSDCDKDEKPAHEVHISKSFWLGQTEVTQAAWKKVMNSDPSRFKGDQLPVERVSWPEAVKYCETIGGRLPTEAEWEYAARAGSTAARYGELDAIAWYDKNSGSTTHAVGGKQSNQFGLFDMLGNVWEWVRDDYGPYKSDAVVDPLVEIKGAPSKVVRGGSWYLNPQDARASLRNRLVPVDRSSIMGFRCVGEFR